MHTKSLEILEKTELPSPQARAILEVMELELAERETSSATKSDLKEAFHALQLEMKGMESRLTRWVFTCFFGEATILGAVYFLLNRR